MTKRSYFILLNGSLILIISGILWKIQDTQRYLQNSANLLRWERIKHKDQSDTAKGFLNHFVKDTILVPGQLKTYINPDSIHSFVQLYQLLHIRRTDLPLPALPDANKLPDILDSLVVENTAMITLSRVCNHLALQHAKPKTYPIRPIVKAIHRDDSVMQVVVEPFFPAEEKWLTFFIHDSLVTGPSIDWKGSLTALKAIYTNPFTNDTQVFKGIDQPHQTEWLALTY